MFKKNNSTNVILNAIKKSKFKPAIKSLVVVIFISPFWALMSAWHIGLAIDNGNSVIYGALIGLIISTFFSYIPLFMFLYDLRKERKITMIKFIILSTIFYLILYLIGAFSGIGIGLVV